MRNFLDFSEARAGAKRSLPRGIFEYIDRGAEAETLAGHTRKMFEGQRVVPRILPGDTPVPESRHLLGQELPCPIIVAPTAFSGLVRHRGEVLAALGARAEGIPYSVATESVISVEEVRAQAGGNLWFQLYMWDREDLWRGLLRRAEAEGIEVLSFTVDMPVFPKRVFNTRNGFGLPVRFGTRNVADVLTHPAWAVDVLGRALASGGLPRFAHHPNASRASVLGRDLPEINHMPWLSWDHLEQVRAAWPGKLLIKGVMDAEDAARSIALGADGIVVSSHGMRNIDISVSPLEVLPAIRARLGPDIPVLADSGVQSGSDIFKLLRAGGRCGDGRQGGALCACLQWLGRRGKDDPHPAKNWPPFIR